eukprot:m.641406 g.641406  ORF g.641406 m.641406 type:complete len:72 (+) comp22630_c0_seq5:160-375(+)
MTVVTSDSVCVSFDGVICRKLGLLERCGHLADEAGIVTPADFLLFTPEELVGTFRFKVGHVRKIMAVLDTA